MTNQNDSRFFDGYTWVSRDADCRLGLCMPSTNPEEAARMFFRRDSQHFHNRGKIRVCYTLEEGGQPVRHEIVL